MASYYLFTSISITSFYWWFSIISSRMKILLPRAESLVISSPSPVTLNQSCNCKHLYSDNSPIYILHMDLALLSRLEPPVGSSSQSVSSWLLASPSFQLLSQNLEITLDSSLLKLHIHFARKFSWLDLQNTSRASLVAQWLRICLPMQGTPVRALVWEDTTCRGATGPMSHNYWACASGACARQQERPRQWEARAPRWRVAPACHN